MRLLRVPVKRAAGSVPSRVWYVQWRDHRGKVHRWAGFREARLSMEFGRHLERLADLARAAVSLDRAPDAGEQRAWLARLPDRTLRKLDRLGLVPPGAAHGARTIADQLVDFTRSQLARDLDPRHVQQVAAHVAAIANGLNVRSVDSIDPTEVESWLADLRHGTSDRPGASVATSNHYLKDLKTFCNWLMRERRMDRNPVAYLRKLNDRFDRRHDRRALEPEELGRLLDAALKGDVLGETTGEDRYWLYRVACEVGLLTGEAGRLRVLDFELAGVDPSLTVPAAYSRKRRRTHVLPLSRDTAAGIQRYFRGRLPSAPAFRLSRRPVETLRIDLATAGIAYRDDAGRVVDMYALRHTAITRLSEVADSFTTLQALARHETPSVTARYAHPRLVNMRAAVEQVAAMKGPPAGVAKPGRGKRRRGRGI